MSYQSPDIINIVNPIGLDAVVQSIQTDLYASLPWLTKSFGRAREFREDGVAVPKCYMGLGEYHNVLPNDFLTAQSFIIARESERWPDYPLNGLERDLSIIFWVNLKQVDDTKDYIFTEILRWQVEKVIKANRWITGVKAFYDDRVEDVFMGYLNPDKEKPAQWLMYPYAGFRYDVTASYSEHADCLTWTSGYRMGTTFMDDIDFVVSTQQAGATTYQNDKLIGKKIRLIREGLLQHPQDINDNWFWSFVGSTGTITVNPAWIKGERVKIEING